MSRSLCCACRVPVHFTSAPHVYDRVLKEVENVMVTLSRQKSFQRLVKFRGNQQEIADCKEKIDHAFKALLVTVSLGLRRSILMSQSSASVSFEDADDSDSAHMCLR
jgi:hypothetical protein